MGADALLAGPAPVLTSVVRASALAGRDEVAAIGVDVVCVPRMSQLISEGGQAFLQRSWTSHELADVGDDTERLATRWAAKEAVMKCLGLGISDLDPHDIEIVSSESGAPSAVLRDSAAERARSLGIAKFHVSASHESGWAVAIAVASKVTEQDDSEVSVQGEEGS
ncbi:MAG: holo-[acyl-carrier-protein] synthase [Acidimicrobiaceae bacterium]|nr:holo-[acyl-carrier-protein] synthase [Acidimicrobiaceae bacterium]MYA73883.1 holo-[acyl-carrier-protein] synthase [Acidimicrobiaceae bacterium]MYD05965.1 holo-[acyl-carrier-protein] synthase [Acidimicrobiaceae bacterium]MYG54908.1 holo-[acyl-carrier-protein] synthase [Acidimicrobiaceae bacterium]MYI58630.1 holo-[acyl-carrier-protein] synthase [Acidimicrobiaceae bacterium]